MGTLGWRKYGSDEERDEARRKRARDRHNRLKSNPNYVEDRRTTSREFRRDMRRQALTILGDVCGRCGFSDERALQIDHRDGGGRQEHAEMGARGIIRAVIEDPLPYQLLCANCNWIKRAENGEEHREGL